MWEYFLKISAFGFGMLKRFLYTGGSEVKKTGRISNIELIRLEKDTEFMLLCGETVYSCIAESFGLKLNVIQKHSLLYQNSKK